MPNKFSSSDSNGGSQLPILHIGIITTLVSLVTSLVIGIISLSRRKQKRILAREPGDFSEGKELFRDTSHPESQARSGKNLPQAADVVIRDVRYCAIPIRT